jgi:hypothetical protein
MRRDLGWKLLVGLTALTATACLNIQPKILGQKGAFSFDAFSTSGSTTFKFNFATYDSGTKMVKLQGSVNSKSSEIGTCNLAGTGCVCTITDSTGANFVTTSTQITYDEPGNYYRCQYTGSATPISVRIANLNGNVVSDTLTIKTPTLADVLGSDLDSKRLRTVSRYACQYTYLQKDGTTLAGFDCLNKAVLCDTNDFCLLKAQFPFYLYADSFSSNFNLKPADKLYNGGGGSQKICGLQIKQLDCVGVPGNQWGATVTQFGLYGQQIGPWQVPVLLPVAPDQPITTMGYAAKTSSITGECPPGLVKRVFFTTTIDTTTILPSHNFGTGQVSTEVSDPTITPAAFQIQKWGQGACNNVTCTLPISLASADIKNGAQTYSSAGQTTFCVIPSSML